MTTTEYSDICAHVEANVDLDYLKTVAAAVAEALHAGEVIEACVQPGDMTRYDLTFVPVWNLKAAPPRVAPFRSEPDVPREWDRLCAYGVSREPGKALVVLTSGCASSAAIALDFTSGGFEGFYLSGALDTALASAILLSMLFNMIAEAYGG